jgi:hypothetical protein
MRKLLTCVCARALSESHVPVGLQLMLQASNCSSTKLLPTACTTNAQVAGWGKRMFVMRSIVAALFVDEGAQTRRSILRHALDSGINPAICLRLGQQWLHCNSLSSLGTGLLMQWRAKRG